MACDKVEMVLKRGEDDVLAALQTALDRGEPVERVSSADPLAARVDLFDRRGRPLSQRTEPCFFRAMAPVRSMASALFLICSVAVFVSRNRSSKTQSFARWKSKYVRITPCLSRTPPKSSEVCQ